MKEISKLKEKLMEKIAIFGGLLVFFGVLIVGALIYNLLTNTVVIELILIFYALILGIGLIVIDILLAKKFYKYIEEGYH
ncbi:MAG: hypothetical protein HWN67_08080 [Candidatus Helarchaeota archaeon]|nr:hypothetical protein [Candidatus Helarchaeota archaeon]